MGGCPLELAQRPPCVALAWHTARCSTPSGVTRDILDRDRGFGLERSRLQVFLAQMALDGRQKLQQNKPMRTRNSKTRQEKAASVWRGEPRTFQGKGPSPPAGPVRQPLAPTSSPRCASRNTRPRGAASCWGPEAPQKFKEVTLMRPIHGNL